MKKRRAKRVDAARSGGVDVVLDTGALLALERASPIVFDLLEEAARRGRTVLIPSGALSQAWRDGRTQARTARLLKQPSVLVVGVGEREAKEIGEFIASTSDASGDVVDAHVALVTRVRRAVVLTSDPEDMSPYGVDVARVQEVH